MLQASLTVNVIGCQYAGGGIERWMFLLAPDAELDTLDSHRLADTLHAAAATYRNPKRLSWDRSRQASIVSDVALAPVTWPRPLLRAVRTSNKYLLNPVMGTLAGRKNWYAAAVRHTGRKSGKQYSTPVVAIRVQDGFIIPLPYGTRVDWLQNVLAAGRATVSAEGGTHDVTEPEVIDAATVLPMLSPRRRRTFERVGIAQYLKVKLA